MGLVNCSIKINGDKPLFIINQISISQSYTTHHYFEVDCTIPSGEEFGINGVKEVLGARIEISFKDKKKSATHLFVGLIDSIQPSIHYGKRHLLIKGFSPSVLLDAGVQFRAFAEKELNTIADGILRNYSIEYDNQATGQVEFSVQVQESDYRYLRRLADAFGQTFYYTGEKLVFGELGGNKSTKIDVHAKNLSSLEAAINICPQSYAIKAYDYRNDCYQTSQSPKRYGSNEPLVKVAIDKSTIYPSININSNQMVVGKAFVNRMEEQLITQQTNELVTISGRGEEVGLTIGGCINLIQKKENTLPGLTQEANYRVTTLNHYYSRGTYTNSFAAIPADHPFPIHTPDTGRPICGPMVAIVKDINDPDQLGRVRVQLNMDTNAALSPWLRVLTSFCSKGGSFWLPSLEDKVLLFSEDFNPENTPFVMGSFYTGGNKASSWETGEKGFRMENIAMIFNDETGTLSIKAKSILMEAEDSIELSKSRKIALEADEVNAKAIQKMTLSGGQHLKQTATKIDLN